ncbi:MAG: phage tail family protein [Deltaproteobacteria bacterium]|nr:phage tail family protein [Deltaproteobacteria bacterium]
MSLIITDTENSVLYTFPADFDLHSWDDRDFSARTKVAERFGRDGGAEVSDKAVSPRRVKVRGAHHAVSAAALKSFLDTLVAALRNRGEAFRFSWETGFYINVSHVTGFSAKRFSRGLAYKSVEIEFTLNCPDPFWYAVTPDSAGPVSITASPQEVSFTCTGTQPAWLSVQMDPSGPWPSVLVENLTDGQNGFWYADPAFGSGNQLVVDSAAGTVRRDGMNTIRHFTGGFLRVLPGGNTLRITGPTGGSIILSARRRYL